MHDLAELGAFVARLTYDAIPEDVRFAARAQIVNMVAAAHGVASSPEVMTLARAVGSFAGAGTSTVLATGQKLAVAEAAMANALCAMGHDFDDIVWMGHTCHSAVFAPLAVAEREGSSARDLITAVVAANEIGGRLGASSFLGPLNGQMVTHIHLVGAAAGTAKLLGLDAPRTTHALAISLAQPTFPLVPAFVAPTSKLLSAATPTGTGIQAAYFARAGMTGARDLLADSRGFWRRFAFAPLPFMLGDLGELWVLRSLTCKTYPGCHFFQTANSSIDEILARTGPLAASDIRRVRIETTKLGAEVDRFGRTYAAEDGPITAVSVNFQLAVTAAVHLLAGRFTTDEMDPAWLAAKSAALRELAARVEIRHDPGLTAEVLTSARAVGAGKRALASLGVREVMTLVRRYRAEYASSLVDADEPRGWLRAVRRFLKPEPPSGPAIGLRFPNRVTVELASGRREQAELLLPVGSLAAPDPRGALEHKFLHETKRTLGERGPQALAAAWALEQQRVPDFVRLVAAA